MNTFIHHKCIGGATGYYYYYYFIIIKNVNIRVTLS